VVATELKRLNPDLVVVVGGPNSVSENVVAQVKALPSPRPAGIQVTRISGSDRYEASRNLVTYAFSVGDQGKFTWVATGTNFPDALSAGAAAGASEEPVLLVDGPKPKLDSVTEGFISLRDEQAPDGVKIAGGPASVSAGIQAQIETINPVTRLDGPDRYAASVAINHASFTASPRVFLATGKNFPDALAGAAYAGAVKAPLFVVPGDCVPSQVLIEIAELGATRVTLLGGEASLSPAVAALTPCEAPE
jgi:putative cell wall-binding protein